MIEVFDCEQGTPEWFECRKGIPTASQFATVLAFNKTAKDKKTRRTYLLKLLGERLTGEPMDSYTNAHMERGKAMEAEARDMYVFLSDLEPARVGFIRNGEKGASPDSLIGDHGTLEIKTKLAHLQLDLLLCDEFPSEHKAQVQGQLWVCEREWCDFCAYWPKLPLFAKRVYRDEPYIKRLAEAVDAFNAELRELQDRIARYGRREAA